MNITLGVVGARYYLTRPQFQCRVDKFVQAVGRTARLESRMIHMEGAAGPVGETDTSVPCPLFDMSAYAAGISDLPKNLPLYLVFNDTTFTKHPAGLLAPMLEAVAASLASFPGPAAAGEVHPSTDLLLRDPHSPSRRHLASFCMLLNTAGFALLREALDALPRDASPPVLRNWLDATCSRFPALRSLLHVHLGAATTPWTWRPLASHALPEDIVLRKAICVATEYVVSAALARNGAVLPVNLGWRYRLALKFALGRSGR